MGLYDFNLAVLQIAKNPSFRLYVFPEGSASASCRLMCIERRATGTVWKLEWLPASDTAPELRFTNSYSLFNFLFGRFRGHKMDYLTAAGQRCSVQF